MVSRKVTNSELSPGDDLDEALVEKKPEGLANRSARDLESLSDLPLREDRTHREVSRENSIPQVLVGTICPRPVTSARRSEMVSFR